MNQTLTTAADWPFGHDACKFHLLGQVLRPQGRLQFLPVISGEAEGTKEARLEASKRMLHREQVVTKLRRIDYGVIGVRQQHEEV